MINSVRETATVIATLSEPVIVCWRKPRLCHAGRVESIIAVGQPPDEKLNAWLERTPLPKGAGRDPGEENTEGEVDQAIRGKKRGGQRRSGKQAA